MPLKPFQVPTAAPSPDPERRRAKALIGGSLEMRRKHGQPSGIQGKFLVDPIFSEPDFDRLKAWCAPDPSRPLTIEIGFQLGEFAAAYCKLHPERRYVGFEVRRKFCEETDARLVKEGVDNALLALVDAREIVPLVVPPGTLDELLLFFPDPWWKLRHTKKRVISPEFVADVAAWLRPPTADRPGGRLLLKTDVQGYADWAEGILRDEANLAVRRLDDPTDGLPLTLRERRVRMRGLPTWGIEARRVST